MPREAREKSSTGIYHIIMRGINRRSIFEDEEDRQKLIERFAYYKTISCYKRFGIDAVKISDEMRQRQDRILKDLKSLENVSIRQIARITRLSQTRVWKA